MSAPVEYLASPLELLIAASGAGAAAALSTAAATLVTLARSIILNRRSVANAEARVRLQADLLANLREEMERAPSDSDTPRLDSPIDLEDWLLDRRELIQSALQVEPATKGKVSETREAGGGD